MLKLQKRLHKIFHPREERKAQQILNTFASHLDGLESFFADNNGLLVLKILRTTSLPATERLNQISQFELLLPLDNGFKKPLSHLLNRAKDGQLNDPVANVISIPKEEWITFIAFGNQNKCNAGIISAIPETPIIKLKLNAVNLSEAREELQEYRDLMIVQFKQEVSKESLAAWSNNTIDDSVYEALIQRLPETRGLYHLEQDSKTNNFVLCVDASVNSKDLIERLESNGAVPDSRANANYQNELKRISILNLPKQGPILQANFNLVFAPR